MKKIAAILPLLALFVATAAQAHVTVKPAQVGVGAFQTFTVSVPSEKPIPTTAVRLVLPEGLHHVSPTVKPGWTINLVKDGDEVKEIVWTGGSIPAEFRDEFTFSSQVPSEEGTVMWKAYQTYRDGSVVAWELGSGDQQPKKADGTNDYSSSGPASTTKIVNDLDAKPAAPQQQTAMTEGNTKSSDSLLVSMIAVILSVFAIYLAKRKTV